LFIPTQTYKPYGIILYNSFFSLYTDMPSRKRTVKYEENTDPVDGDKNVEVSEEQSVNDDEPSTTNQEEVSESEDERYKATAGN
jgi:hypothetical protein